MENPANKKMKGPFRPDIMEKIEEHPEGLSQFLLSIETAVSKGMIEDFVNPDMDWKYNPVFDILQVQFRSWLYGEDMARQEVSYPAGWWQAFKFRWFPGWLEKVWPVEYETVVMDAKILYPKLRSRLNLPDEPHVLHVVKEEYSE